MLKVRTLRDTQFTNLRELPEFRIAHEWILVARIMQVRKSEARMSKSEGSLPRAGVPWGFEIHKNSDLAVQK